jgi:hypothetical protein
MDIKPQLPGLLVPMSVLAPPPVIGPALAQHYLNQISKVNEALLPAFTKTLVEFVPNFMDVKFQITQLGSIDSLAVPFTLGAGFIDSIPFVAIQLHLKTLESKSYDRMLICANYNNIGSWSSYSTKPSSGKLSKQGFSRVSLSDLLERVQQEPKTYVTLPAPIKAEFTAPVKWKINALPIHKEWPGFNTERNTLITLALNTNSLLKHLKKDYALKVSHSYFTYTPPSVNTVLELPVFCLQSPKKKFACHIIPEVVMNMGGMDTYLVEHTDASESFFSGIPDITALKDTAHLPRSNKDVIDLLKHSNPGVKYDLYSAPFGFFSILPLYLS